MYQQQMTRRVTAAILLGVAAACYAQNDTEPLRPGDMVYIDVYRRQELSTTTQLDPEGYIMLPYAGRVNIAGLSEQDASATAAAAFSRVLKNPRVTLSRSVVARNPGVRKEAMKTEFVPLQNANAEEVSNAMQGMTTEGGSVSFVDSTNTLIITDEPAAVANLLSVASRLDNMESLLTQVRIEARLAEVKIGAMKELGVRWFVQGDELGGGYYPMRGQDPGINALRGANANPAYNESVGGNSNNNLSSSLTRRFVDETQFDRRLNIPVHVPGAGQLFVGFLNENIDLGIILDALVADNKAEMLAEPHLLSVNHKRAEIEMVDEFPYFEFGTEVSGRSTTSTRFMDLGIKLAVTPHVHQDGAGRYVKLELEPEVSFPVGSSNNVPIRSVRRSRTEANVRDGQTLVVGGIYRNELRDTEQRVPGLGRVPVVGNLFKRKEKAVEQRELMVFVTPTVHDSPESVTWDRMLSLSQSSEIVGPALSPFISQGEARKE
jgi:type II secretory pathway component GspD/PulD (secretin)